jgi:hypothetical protein
MTLTSWQDWLVLTISALCGLVGVVLTVLTLPGAWVVCGAGLVIAVVRPDMVPWWVVVILVLLAVTGEVIEFAASALGATKAGATKQAAWASIGGSILGAILGMPFLPPIGPIVGGALGAAVCAVGVERWYAKKTWKESATVGGGAALGRLASTVAKTLVTVGCGMILCLAVVV